MFSKIFSVRRSGINRVFTILGIKIKLPIANMCCSLPDNLKDKNINFPHPIGIVIAQRARIGKNCIIYQNVTIGAKSYESALCEEDCFPTIKDNVTIYAGACVIGKVTVGNNVVIGANAVVVKDVPDNSIVVGNPARIIKK